MNEAQTRKDLIDPAIEAAGWTKANGCQVLVEQAAVEFAPGKDGMIHISKLSDQRVDKVTDVVNVGDIVLVKVIKIDEKHRVDLRLKEVISKAVVFLGVQTPA